MRRIMSRYSVAYPRVIQLEKWNMEEPVYIKVQYDIDAAKEHGQADTRYPSFRRRCPDGRDDLGVSIFNGLKGRAV